MLFTKWYPCLNDNKLCACSGNTPETRGTAYVVYEDIFDAKNACDHLSGFNVCNRYLVVLYYNANRVRLSLPLKYKRLFVLWCLVLILCFCKGCANFGYVWFCLFFSLPLSGIPENGHEEKRRAAETSQGEIWHKYGPPEVTRWLSLCSPSEHF